MQASQYIEPVSYLFRNQNTKLEARLTALRSDSAATQISPEDRKRIDDNLEVMRKEWRRRKRMFNDMWGTVTESIQGSLAEFRVYIMCYPLKSVQRSALRLQYVDR